MPESHSLAARAILALALLLGLGHALVYFNRVLQDDAYISFIYARNLVRGEGLVYNAGEPAVEGYTNFLWTLLIAGGMELQIEPAVFAQIVGIVSVSLTIGLTFLLARELGCSPLFAAAGALLLAVRTPVAMEAVGGLETAFFSLLVVLALVLRTGRRTRQRDVLSSLSLAAAALTRPEGWLVFALLEAFEFARARNARSAALVRSFVPRALPFLLIGGLHLVWRLATYGDLVPNTFHAKVTPGSEAWLRGFEYVFRGVGAFGPFFFLLPFCLPWPRSRRETLLPCLLLAAVYPLYVVAVGGDFKPTYRYLVPVMPVWCALAATGVERLAAMGGREWDRVWAGSLFAALALWGVVSEQSSRNVDPDRLDRHRDQVAAGRKLDEILPPDAWIASTSAGRIPFYADRRTLDMLGLNDAHIARQEIDEFASRWAGHEKGDGRYVLERAPDAILFLGLQVLPKPLRSVRNRRGTIEELAFGTSERQLIAEEAFWREYRVLSIPLPHDEKFLNVFVRRSLEL